ncbi:PREDICTED: zinc finger CCCH domain-containing protein 20-like [Nelumbo nucifera]|uniref:Zinc finger CCCH domain-containing protein 20-like n=1 Tax=Nelumbo nucifera TaxID=4432 RepID=A0A1U8AVU5_NELNU|nr:PREDICTED: zinc finger CCCH domain-containing protein 20-like [Nelumbo nucifera]
MMIGEGNQQNPTVHVPPWTLFDDTSPGMKFPLPVSGISMNANSNGIAAGDYCPFLLGESLAALQCYLPSNDVDADSDLSGRESDMPINVHTCDEFRMYEFKVRRCARGRSHDWTECPFAHPGEKARRRDPRKFHYSGTACPDFRKGNCKRGDACEFAHGVFECWLHPARYRTQPCKDGTSCRRRVCFFAHTPEQLRVLPQQSPRTPVSPESYDGSPLRQALDSYFQKNTVISSPTSTLMSPPMSPPSDSPPMSPNSPSLSRLLGSNSINDVVTSMRQLQLSKVKSVPTSWSVQVGSGFVSPRGSTLRPGFFSLPSTPTRTPTRCGLGYLDTWDGGSTVEEEPAMERVESGRDLRAKIYEKLSKENSLDPVDSPSPTPDVGWVSELVK